MTKAAPGLPSGPHCPALHGPCECLPRRCNLADSKLAVETQFFRL